MTSTFRAYNLVLVALVALAFALTPLSVGAKGPDTVVNGGGMAILTDPGGNTYPIQFTIAAKVADDGSAKGHINFVFQGSFAQDWGAAPGATDMFRINGKIGEGSISDDGTVTVKGWLTEVDYRHGEGVFFEVDDPFTIVTGGSYGTDSLLLQWCLLSAFLVDVPGGTLYIH